GITFAVRIQREHVDQALRVVVRQRSQKHRVDHAEDRAVRADAEGECKNDNRGESGSFEQHPPGVLKVGNHDRYRYSVRSAWTGSTRVARLAGSKQARSAIAASTMVAPPNSAGLCAETSNNCEASKRPSARAAT